MGTSAFFDVIDRLLALAPAQMPDGVTVFDGYPDMESAPDALLAVGVPDPSDESTATAATSRQEWAHANFGARDEEGDVWCVASVVNGANDQAAARASVKAILAAVEGLLRDNTMLRLSDTDATSPLVWVSFGTDLSYLQNQNDTGALAEVSFTVHYRARI